MAYCNVPKQKRKKLYQTAEKAYLVGYSKNGKEYRIYLLWNKKIIIRLDVKFMVDRAFRKSREIPSEEKSKDDLLV